ncbi:sodium transport system ATP-binding protein [Thermotomaculum hydrothermale]|uniref:Sodium transport system ATP-binding protein n=1 Tax=Thermotomaculum hydrothermale TaxID=981385 RepID=A0A7R6SZ91_9BACT|nr:ABC transporter ATP-binding protein [Thermotomaculum hydrothermale]BBB32580.1 sodium transport system ATP-binding protein [Thermotomaculum hydrothermale]
MIEVRDLRKVFKSKRKKVEALKGISFDAHPGEIFGLLGPNGAGKTTTLRILSTMLTPTDGDARIDGVSVKDNPMEIRRKIGFLSTETGLYDKLTGEETLKFFGKLSGLEEKEIKERSDFLFSSLGLEKDRKRLVGEYSTGMKQKLSIARALIHNPEIIIFDEPTNGLDILTTKTVVDFLLDMKLKGKTVVISTHILDVVEKLCDRVAIIHRGKIVANNTITELKNEYNAKTIEEVFFSLVNFEGEK